MNKTKSLFTLVILFTIPFTFWQCGGKGNNNPEPQKLTITGIDPSSGPVGKGYTGTGQLLSSEYTKSLMEFNT